MTDEEAQEILAYDKAVDATDKACLPFDLNADQNKVAQSYTRTGTRKHTKVKKTRKPNATKRELINAFADFLVENPLFSIENVVITNAERMISFQIGNDSFEITLVQKRKPKK